MSPSLFKNLSPSRTTDLPAREDLDKSVAEIVILLINGVQVSQDLTAGETTRIADRPKVVVVASVLVYSTMNSSPESPDISEWTACDKPLGILNLIWAASKTFDILIAYHGRYQNRLSKKFLQRCVFYNTIAPRHAYTRLDLRYIQGFPISPGSSPSALHRTPRLAPVGFTRHTYGGLLLQFCGHTITFGSHSSASSCSHSSAPSCSWVSWLSILILYLLMVSAAVN